MSGAVRRTALPFDSDLFRIRIDLLEPYEDLLSPLLSADELETAAKMARRHNQLESGITRACLKLLAADRLQTSPRQLSVARDSRSKPFVTTGETDYRSFNVSHSYPWSLIVLGDRGRLGVDVEAMRPIENVESLAELTMVPAELEKLMSLPSEERGPFFLQNWTRKEAVMKVLGIGLNVPLKEILIDPPLYEDMEAVTVSRGAESYGTFNIIDVSTDDYVAAIAFQESDDEEQKE